MKKFKIAEKRVVLSLAVSVDDVSEATSSLGRSEFVEYALPVPAVSPSGVTFINVFCEPRISMEEAPGLLRSAMENMGWVCVPE